MSGRVSGWAGDRRATYVCSFSTEQMRQIAAWPRLPLYSWVEYALWGGNVAVCNMSTATGIDDGEGFALPMTPVIPLEPPRMESVVPFGCSRVLRSVIQFLRMGFGLRST